MGHSDVRGRGKLGMAKELTKREYEVLALVSEGAGNREVAEQLAISARTVQTHVRSIMTKTDTRSRTAIAVWAITNGLVPLRFDTPGICPLCKRPLPPDQPRARGPEDPRAPGPASP